MQPKALNQVEQAIVNRLLAMCPKGRKMEFVIGGSAAIMLFNENIREDLHDLDVYCEHHKLLIDADRKLMPVDVANNTYFWGQINIGDAKQSPVLIDNEFIKIRYLSPETMFIHKTDSGRDKDIEDVAFLANYLDSHAILKRMNTLKKFNSYESWYLSAENLLAEIQCQYAQPITLEMIDLLELESDDAFVLSRTFGLPQFTLSPAPKQGLGARL